MSARLMKPGESLYGDNGCAIVVTEDTTPAEGLILLLQEQYGGDPFAADNPAIITALPDVRVETWRSCTKAWQENENVEGNYDSYWSPNGDGKRRITVAYYNGNAYDLGELAEAAERPGGPVVEPGEDKR